MQLSRQADFSEEGGGSGGERTEADMLGDISLPCRVMHSMYRSCAVERRCFWCHQRFLFPSNLASAENLSKMKRRFRWETLVFFPSKKIEKISDGPSLRRIAFVVIEATLVEMKEKDNNKEKMVHKFESKTF